MPGESERSYLLERAWVDFLRFAVNDRAIWARFLREKPVLTPKRHFGYWATLVLWGNEGVPERFLRDAKAFYPELYAEMERDLEKGDLDD